MIENRSRSIISLRGCFLSSPFSAQRPSWVFVEQMGHAERAAVNYSLSGVVPRRRGDTFVSAEGGLLSGACQHFNFCVFIFPPSVYHGHQLTSVSSRSCVICISYTDSRLVSLCVSLCSNYEEKTFIASKQRILPPC